MFVANARAEGMPKRRPVYGLSRAIIVALGLSAVGSLFWSPDNAFTWCLDILVRTYLMFLGTVMAHEGTHGHLGRTRAANFWWGRLALLPSMVPFTNFRKTHRLHHAHTNEPDRDPDYFLNCPRAWEFALRAVAMPHHWFFWLWKRGKVKRADIVELIWNYALIFLVYGAVALWVEPYRLLWGLVPALVGVSLLLWYAFAYETHEGYSTGAAASRSHNYYGRMIYWFSLGLSMHRAHHLDPKLSWLDLKEHVESAPGPLWRRLFPKRDFYLPRESV